MQSLPNGQPLGVAGTTPNEIADEIEERESLHGEDLDVVDDNVSSLSKELLLAKQNNQMKGAK